LTGVRWFPLVNHSLKLIFSKAVDSGLLYGIR